VLALVVLVVLLVRLQSGWVHHVLDAKPFRSDVQLVAGAAPGLRIGRSRRVSAAWCHTALVLRRRGLLGGTWVLGVRFPAGPVRPFTAVGGHRLGRDTVSLVLELDDGSRLRVVARRRDVDLMVGPFLAAAVQAGGRGPGRGQGQRDRRG